MHAGYSLLPLPCNYDVVACKGPVLAAVDGVAVGCAGGATGDLVLFGCDDYVRCLVLYHGFCL